MGNTEDFPLSSILRWEPLPGMKVAPYAVSQRLNTLLFTY
jgi:hypothetical protein